jgi:hypothetical protein
MLSYTSIRMYIRIYRVYSIKMSNNSEMKIETTYNIISIKI